MTEPIDMAKAKQMIEDAKADRTKRQAEREKERNAPQFPGGIDDIDIG